MSCIKFPSTMAWAFNIMNYEIEAAHMEKCYVVARERTQKFMILGIKICNTSHILHIGPFICIPVCCHKLRIDPTNQTTDAPMFLMP